jgi:uncharacterized membrane protein
MELSHIAGTSNGHPGAGLAGRRMDDTERLLSVLGGGALALIGLRRRRLGLPLALLGGGLIVRGVTGRGLTDMLRGGERSGTTIRQAITVNRPADELFDFWANVENLPRFMKHIKEVRDLGAGRSHWVAQSSAGGEIAWDAEMRLDRERRTISWTTLPGAGLEHTGHVRFVPAPGGRGTEVRVAMWYAPPMGPIGQVASRLLGIVPELQMGADLHRLKQYLETGQVATTEGQPSARARDFAKAAERAADTSAPRPKDAVMQGSKESFPASDPPAWMAGNKEGQP